VLLVCLTARGQGFALPRWLQAGTSLVAIMLILGIQYWLIKKAYPLATYGDLSVVQLLYNVKSVLGFVPFVLFMTPVGWTAAMLARRRYAMEAGQAGVFAAAVIFFAMWVTVGRIKEVRIFLPFALALAPLTVEFAMQGFLAGSRELS
jgi:hypothetical protein